MPSIRFDPAEVKHGCKMLPAARPPSVRPDLRNLARSLGNITMSLASSYLAQIERAGVSLDWIVTILTPRSRSPSSRTSPQKGLAQSGQCTMRGQRQLRRSSRESRGRRALVRVTP